MNLQKQIALAASTLCVLQPLSAQGPAQLVEKAQVPVFIRPYRPTTMPPVQLQNSDRLHQLIRAGKLYLTLQDAIAAAIENNLDLELDRYGPLSAEWSLKRNLAGGPLRGVTGGNTLSNQAASGQGVLGSEVTAGLASNGGGSGGGGAGGVIQQIGPITPNLDPVFQNATAFVHSTYPQQNLVVSQVPALIDSRHIINSFLQQGLISGGFVQITANESYLNENAPGNFINPSVAPVVQITIKHSLLQGFGVAVNRRFITVAEKQVGAARESFRSQLLNLVAQVLNDYWDLVAADDDFRVRQRGLDASRKFLDDTKKQIELGVVARVELLRAESDVDARQQELNLSLINVRQEEGLLKNELSRTGTEDPLIDAAEIVPLDRIEVPQNDELPGLRDLLKTALARRPDVALAKIGDETSDILALGTINGLLPSLQGVVATWDAGLAGTAVPGQGAPPNFVGGLGTALGQVFRRDFYNQRAGASFNAALGNRTAQADFGIDQLQLRQGDLIERRNMNAIVVGISNQVVALRQARTRYNQAVDTRTLQDQLLEKETQMFNYGTATIADVVASRRSLLNAQLAEVQAVAAYGRAKNGLDQVLGETLEANHVSLDDGLRGHVNRESKVPDTLPSERAAPPALMTVNR